MVHRYDGATCCNQANQTQSLINTTLHPLSPAAVCGQIYQAGTLPAPSVFVSFDYCWSNCSGIGLSKPTDTGQWAAPIVQFILPAVIFSATIPRRKKLTFSNLIKSSKQPFGIVGSALHYALIPVVFDNIIWIITIIVGAGPLIVGGLHEAWLDYRIVKHMQRRLRIRRLRDSRFYFSIVRFVRGLLRLPARAPPQDWVGLIPGSSEEAELLELLVIVVSGNLLEQKPIGPIEQIVNSLSLHKHVKEVNQMPQRPSTTNCPPDMIPPQTNASVSVNTPSCRDEFSSIAVYKRERLLSMLRAQADFGGAVGAPVLFYLGAFVYTILDLESDPSNQDSAISLAFGIEWMIIVHVAIISGCLLASNNPATSAAIVGKIEVQKPRLAPSLGSRKTTGKAMFCDGTHIQAFWLWLVDRLFSDVCDSSFQPTWMWRRGANKRMWLKQSKTWQTTRTKELDLSWGHWVSIWFVAVILIVVPPAAGAGVSYATPPKGWSCRSLSFAFYAASQIILSTNYIFRNIWYYENYPAYDTFRQENPYRSKLTLNRLNVFWMSLALLSCVGGTIMQLVGIFKNCFCYVNTPMWIHLPDAVVQLASDTIEARSSHYSWIVLGGVATGFMGVNSIVGWWYQRYVRFCFIHVVKKMYPDTSSPTFVPNIGQATIPTQTPNAGTQATPAAPSTQSQQTSQPQAQFASKPATPNSPLSAPQPPVSQHSTSLAYPQYHLPALPFQHYSNPGGSGASSTRSASSQGRAPGTTGLPGQSHEMLLLPSRNGPRSPSPLPV